MLTIVVSFVSGIVCLLLVELYVFVKWFRSQPVAKKSPNSPAVLNSEDVTNVMNLDVESHIGLAESCECLNLVLFMLFHQWKDSVDLKKFFLQKINAEMDELMFTKVVGKVLQEIKVCDYSFGPSVPVIKSAKLISVSGQGVPDEIDIALDIDYGGGFHVSFDAEVVFGRRAYVSVKVLKLAGHARFQMSFKRFPHWSLSFYSEPELDLEVKSQVQGRDIPHLSTLISNQLKKAVRKKHTLPAYKVRFKPFFRKPKPRDEENEIYVHDKKITVGKLSVEVRQASHLAKAQKAVNTYCTLEISSSPRKTQPLRVEEFSHSKIMEIEISRVKSESIGVLFCQLWIETNEERRVQVIVENVTPDSAASRSCLKRGDFVMSVGKIRVTSSDQAARLMKHSGQTINLTIQRSLSHNPLRVESDIIPDDTVSVDGGTSEAEHEEVNEQESLLSDHSQVDINVQREMLQPKRRQRKPAVESHSFGNEDIIDGARLSRPELPPEEFVFVDAQERTLQTSAVPACHNPMWNELFEFDVSDVDRYLNVSVWNQLQDWDTDMLIGHVSVPLMNIALQCLMTTSGSHVQHYVLVPAEPVKASRAEVRATGLLVTSEELPSQARYQGNRIHAGALFLRFLHSRDFSGSDSKEKDDFDGGRSEGLMDSVNQVPIKVSGRHVRGSGHPLRPQVERNHHHFVSTAFHYQTRCDFCRRKIWRKSAVQCTSCSMKCHIKCENTCFSQTTCPFVRVPIDSSNVTNSENPAVETEDTKDEYMSARHGKSNTNELRTSGKDESTAMACQAARTFGRELYRELPEENRHDWLSAKIAELEEEIRKLGKNRCEVRDLEAAATDEKAKNTLMAQAKKLGDQEEALALLMKQYLVVQDNEAQEEEPRGQTDNSML